MLIRKPRGQDPSVCCPVPPYAIPRTPARWSGTSCCMAPMAEVHPKASPDQVRFFGRGFLFPLPFAWTHRNHSAGPIQPTVPHCDFPSPVNLLFLRIMAPEADKEGSGFRTSAAFFLTVL